jgi:hypothetical protein
VEKRKMNKRMRMFYWLIVAMAIVALSIYVVARVQFVKALGPVDPSDVVSGNVFVQIWGRNSAGGNVWIGCIAKPDANGNWYILGGNHTNVGCTGISQSDSAITVNYAPLDKVVTSSVDADETMVINGYDAGASVGLSSSVIMIGN